MNWKKITLETEFDKESVYLIYEKISGISPEIYLCKYDETNDEGEKIFELKYCFSISEVYLSEQEIKETATYKYYLKIEYPFKKE